jgi:hypothetical protein
MEITKLEKAALITTGAGAAFMTLLWNLAVSVDSVNGWIVGLRILFALVSFAAFDLVLLSIVLRGLSISGIAALIVVSGLSGAIGLEVAGVVEWKALHAAPALALAAFGAHLMFSGVGRAAPTTEPASTINNTQINVGVLPRTFAQFAAARAAEMPDATTAQIAAELGTGESTIRKLLDRAAVTVTTTTQED